MHKLGGLEILVKYHKIKIGVRLSTLFKRIIQIILNIILLSIIIFYWFLVAMN